MSDELRRTKCYRIIMSKGDDIQIDAEELDKVVEGMNQGAIVVVKRGVANPSYITSIVADTERHGEWVRETNYSGEIGERSRIRGLIPLKSIYEGTGTTVERLVNEATARQIKAVDKKLALDGERKV